jgi:hypothetical protein
MKMNNDPEWLKQKAEAEDRCEVSVEKMQVAYEILKGFAEKRVANLDKHLHDEREENYRLRLKIQELEDKLARE